MTEISPLHKARTPKRFYFITALIYVPVLIALALIHALWYGWLAVGVSFALLFWMRSTPMWHGFRVVLCFALAFWMALSGLYVSRPQRNISLMGQIGREAVRFFTHLPLDASVRRGDALSATSNWNVPEGYAFEVVLLENSRLELLRQNGSQSKRAVLQIHGGAFMAGLSDLYRLFAERYSAMVEGGVVATLDYRLWPEYGYPCQQQDAMDAWEYLTGPLGILPQDILVAGDSAGGNLALSLCLRLRDEGKPLPGALVCMSPWADLSNSGSSHYQNATLDPTFGVDSDSYDGRAVGVVTGYETGLNAKDPYVSPSFGDYRDFPPMLLQAAKNEVLLSDSEMIVENAQNNGVDCHLTVYESLFHVFQGSLGLLPESQEAWAEIAAFVKGALFR